jgi:sterol desaturase/sphingolipid hydroxylase (fatty acid hydroxylase superfamily)
MINFIITFVIATLIANFTEWFVHKYILHGLGKKKDSFFHFHWRHHHTCRKYDNKDEIYVNWKTNKDVWKEAISIISMGLFNIIWLWIWPPLFYCLVFWSMIYFFMHAKSHTNVKWGNRWMPWHRDHHLGSNQDLNYCVTFPLFDYIMKTRKKY